MANLFVISDTHFGHESILNFVDSEGARIRNFACVEEMDEAMVDRWNAVVRPKDKVYHLGDVSMRTDNFAILDRLNGHKRLVKGNHDEGRAAEYLKYFDEIYACRVLDSMIFTHIPIHPMSMGKFKANVHGHTHAQPPFSPKYVNVSVERINYTPISLEEIKKLLEEN